VRSFGSECSDTYVAAVICSVFHSFDEAVAAWSGFGRLKIADCMPYTGLIASQLADAPRSIRIQMSFSLPASADIQTLLYTLFKHPFSISQVYYIKFFFEDLLTSCVCLSVFLSVCLLIRYISSYLNANLAFTWYTPLPQIT
jgi:hypothetical protein